MELDILNNSFSEPKVQAAWVLHNSFLTSYGTNGSSGGVPSETYAFDDYASIDYTYHSYDPKGEELGSETFSWNLGTGKTATTITGTPGEIQVLTGDLVIPEPASASLLAIAGLFAGTRRRRRNPSRA